MLDELMYNRMWNEFKKLGQAALYMSHYDLIRDTSIDDPHQWKLFLMEPEVIDWIQSELKVLQEAELKKLIKDIGDSNSVGKAQLINVLSRLNEDKEGKDGPIFIYTYIPLSKEQKQAENVQELDIDPFAK